MTSLENNAILIVLNLLKENDIKDIAFLLTTSNDGRQLRSISNAHQLIANVRIWYGSSAPSAIYHAMIAANMPLLAFCIVKSVPQFQLLKSPIRPLKQLLFNVAVQFPDTDVPSMWDALCQSLAADGDAGSFTDALDVMMQLLERSAVTDTSVEALRSLGERSPTVASLILAYRQTYAAGADPPQVSVAAPPNRAAAAAESSRVAIHPSPPIDAYRIRNPVCVIVNVHRIPDRPDRVGSQFDVDRLEKLFRLQFRYQVFKLLDKRRDELVSDFEKIKSLMFSCNHIFDCLVVFVMSHGTDDTIELADGERLHYWDGIVKPFLDGCLRDRPKIFFFQCCRGELLHQAQPVLHCDGPAAVDGRTVSQLDNVDLYVCHSTFQGFAAIREEGSGSWFIQTLCRVLEGQVRMDLECLRMTVTRDLTDRRANIGNSLVNQTPVVEKNTLTKHVYLKPEMTEN